MSAESIVKRGASLAATLVAILAVAWLGWLLLRWTILDATWNASSYADCAPAGACWAVLRARYGLILFGLFPPQEHWRPATACAIVIATAALLQWPRLWRPDVIGLAIAAVAIVFLILMYGGGFGASFVSTDRQASAEGGELHCEVHDDAVTIGASAVRWRRTSVIL